MQSTVSRPSWLDRDGSRYAVFNNETTPRERNRLHNQAVKRAKANIRIRRDQAVPSLRASNGTDDFEKGRSTDMRTQIEVHESMKIVVLSPKFQIPSGGLRGDPFNSFPIIADGCVPSAVDYFLQHYAPVHINPKKEGLEPGDSLSLSKRYFALALEHVSMFELMVTLAQASHLARQGNGRKPTREVMIHYGKGVEALRMKMEAASACDDDATILTVMVLLGIALIYNDFAGFETHLMGLRRLVDMRGGLDNLGWEDFIKNSIVGLESVWAYRQNQKLTIAPTESKIKLEYPKHPFPPKLCILISKLPIGFGELSLSGHLSIQVITILSRVSHWIDQLHNGRKQGDLSLGEANGTYFKQAHACLELVGHPKLNLVERILCFALVACTLETYSKSRPSNPIHQRILESLTEKMSRENLHSLDGECSLWMGLVVAGPSADVSCGETILLQQLGEGLVGAARPRDILLDTVMAESAKARNWKLVVQTVQKFFWDEQLLQRWRSVWELGLTRHRTKRKEGNEEYLAI